MQKEQNVATSKRIIIIFIFISFYSFSQKKEIIKDSDDYVILNKALERFFFFKHERDSIELVDLMLIEKKNPNNIEIQKKIKKAKKEIKNDTIYIKAIADKILYNTFFNKKARWKKKRYKKFAEDLETIFSPNEIEHYQEQLKNNSYLWSAIKINSRDGVIIEKKYNYTREEAIRKGILERDELGRILIQRTNSYFTFAKPIYSKNHNIALIAYNYNTNFILYVYERIKNEWVFRLVLSESYLL